jgi:hypothetical protein
MFGQKVVPVYLRGWKAALKQPYRKTYRLLPGQHWHDAPVSVGQWENYALDCNGQAVPVGGLIARELLELGAIEAVFTELWAGKCVLVDSNFTCVPAVGRLGELLVMLRNAAGGRLGGLPDVLALFADGRVAMREAKNVAAKDRISAKQHAFAQIAQNAIGERLDLAVVEWG